MRSLLLIAFVGIVWFVVTRYYRWVGRRMLAAARSERVRSRRALAGNLRSGGEAMVNMSEWTGRPALVGGLVALAAALILFVARHM